MEQTEVFITCDYGTALFENDYGEKRYRIWKIRRKNNKGQN